MKTLGMRIEGSAANDAKPSLGKFREGRKVSDPTGLEPASCKFLTHHHTRGGARDFSPPNRLDNSLRFGWTARIDDRCIGSMRLSDRAVQTAC